MNPRYSIRNGRVLIIGLAAMLAVGALFHTLYGGERFAHRGERMARHTLDYYEQFQVEAHYQRSPLHRIMLLSGPADDFQRSELVRIIGKIPGNEQVKWVTGERLTGGGFDPLPLWLEVEAFALAGFGLGWLVSYVVVLRRRWRQWDRF